MEEKKKRGRPCKVGSAEHLYHIRLTHEDYLKLRKYANKYGGSMAWAFRHMLKRQFDQTFGDEK